MLKSKLKKKKVDFLSSFHQPLPHNHTPRKSAMSHTHDRTAGTPRHLWECHLSKCRAKMQSRAPDSSVLSILPGTSFTCGLPPGTGDDVPMIGGNHTAFISILVKFTQAFLYITSDNSGDSSLIATLAF